MRRIRILLLALCCILLGLEANAQKDKRPTSYNYQRGYEAFQGDDYEEALDYFTRELQDNPKNGFAHALMAVVYYYNDEYGKALNSADQAIKHLPKKESEYQVLAHVTKSAVQLVLEDTAQAVSTLTTAIKNFPKESDLYEKRAQVYYELGQYDLSDADYRKMVELAPGETTGYMGQGRNANAQKRWEEAIKQFDYAAKLSSGYSAAYAFRAESYIGMKKWDEATDDLMTALKLDSNLKAFGLATELKDPALTMMASKLKVQSTKAPNESQWPYIIGTMYESNDQYEKAIEYYNDANNKDPNLSILFRIASCHYSTGNYQQALAAINQALNMDSTDTDCLTKKANIYLEMEDLSASLEQWNKVIELDPEDGTYYLQRGWVKKYSGDIDGAMEDISMCIVLLPKLSMGYIARGDLYTLQGEAELARQDYNKVIELEKNPEDHQCIYYAYQSLGENDKAIALLDSVIRTDSTDESAFYNAACIYSRMHNKDKALEYLGKSMELGNRSFGHMKYDPDMDFIRDTEEYKSLIEQYRTSSQGDETPEQAACPMVTTEVPFTKDAGVCMVKCQINGLPLSFVFDTGASDVTLSMVEATFMVKNGYLTDSDIVGSQRYMDANGNVTVGTVINLKKVDFGGLSLTNVRASVVRNQKAPLLLGQSVLGRLGKIEIDNQQQVLKITHPQDL